MIFELIILDILVVTNKWPFGMSDSVASVVIPTLSSIIVFALGWIITVLYNASGRRKSIISYRNAVFEWTDLVIRAVQKQVQSLKTLSEKLASSQSLYPERYEFSRSMSDKLTDLSAEKVISVFIENCRFSSDDKRAKYSYNLISQYDFLSSIESFVKENYDAYNHHTNALRERWNGLCLSLQHEIDAVTPKFPKDFEVRQCLNIVIETFLKDRGQVGQIEEAYSKLIAPLGEAVKYCKLAFPEVRCYQSAYECISGMALLYEQWSELTKGYSEVFSFIASTIDESLAALREVVDYFKNKTRIPLWVR